MVTPLRRAASWSRCPMKRLRMPENSWRVLLPGNPAELPEHNRANRSKPMSSLQRRLTPLKRILPRGEISFEKSVLESHSGDKWFAAHKPDAVALPQSTKSVSEILRFASKHRIPVTPRGAGH